MSARSLGGVVLAIAVHAFGDVFSYECDSVPVESGWTLLQEFCEPDEWAQDGWLFHHVELCDGLDPPVGQQVDYMRSLSDFDGAETFFVEWRVETDGDRSEIPFLSPVALTTGSRGGAVHYRFTIASNQVRFIRDNSLPFVWADIAPDVPHTYRLELYSEELYVFYLDGELIDSGVPEGPYPAVNPQINIRVSAKFFDSTTKWDYIRYGTIPSDGSGDFDGDGDHDLRDYYFFQKCVNGVNTPSEPGCRWGDMDQDNDVDLLDFAQFQIAFTGSD